MTRALPKVGVGRLVKSIWSRFWSRMDRDRDAKLIKAQIADARKRHARVDYLHAALRELRLAQLRATR